MRTEVTANSVHVFLSRRNLLTLLAKLDGHPADSVRTLAGPSFEVPTLVTAEEDDVHYAHPNRLGEPPGTLHPATEDALA